MCGMLGKAGSVTEARSYDDTRGRKNVAGVHGSVTGKNKSATGGMEMQRVGTEVQWGHGFMVYYTVFLGMKRDLQIIINPFVNRLQLVHKIYPMHQTPAVILCLAGCSELDTQKSHVIKRANLIL